MDTALTETQRMLQDSVRSYLRNEVPFNRIRDLEAGGGWDTDLWRYLQSAGFLALPFPEDMGGAAGDEGAPTDLGVLLEELTRRAVMIPFLETMASALAIQRQGDASVASEIVGGVINGAAATAWASKTATEVPMMAHQLHGGIGFTEEYDLHFFSRRGKQRAVAWGTADECLAVLASSIEEAERWL